MRRSISSPTAAGGQRLWNANKGAAKLAVSAAPASYAEFTFYAEAGRGYHIWLRGKAEQNAWVNDSAYLQFSGTVDALGLPTYRIGTTGYVWFSLEEGSNAGISEWGWQDNGYGLDQIVISPAKNLLAAPGTTKDDTTIVVR